MVTVFYLMMNISYLTVLTKEEMISGNAVGMAFGEKVFGSFVFIITLGVAISAFGCALALQFGITR